MNLKAGETLQHRPQLFKLPDDLFDYQKEDLLKLTIRMRDQRVGGIGPVPFDGFGNFSKMGTGKTPVTLAYAMQQSFSKVMIMCSKTLQLEWARQIQDWCGFQPSVSRGGSYSRLDPLFDDMMGVRKQPFFITNYETFRVERHLDTLKTYPFDLIVIDEAHRLRNPRRKRTKGVFEFLQSQTHAKLLLMTGSPIVNSPVDVHTLLSMIDPIEYNEFNRGDFLAKYCSYEVKRSGAVKTYRTFNLDKLAEEHEPFTVKRTKDEPDVKAQLPDKYFRSVILEMGEVQREQYDQMEKELFILLDSGESLKAKSVLSLLTRLRQINLDPRILGTNSDSGKTEFLKEFLEDNPDEKLVVFSCFRQYIELLDLDLHDVPHVMVHGKMNTKERARNIEKFQTDPNIKVVLGTIQVMGEGITLHAASNVMIMDRWWTPAVNDQAIDRLHRIGQKNAVQVILPMHESSIDMALDRILGLKALFASEYFAGGQGISIMDMLDDRKAEIEGVEYEKKDHTGEDDITGEVLEGDPVEHLPDVPQIPESIELAPEPEPEPIIGPYFDVETGEFLKRMEPNDVHCRYCCTDGRKIVEFYNHLITDHNMLAVIAEEEVEHFHDQYVLDLRGLGYRGYWENFIFILEEKFDPEWDRQHPGRILMIGDTTKKEEPEFVPYRSKR